MARGDIDQGYVEEIIDAANAGDTSGFTRSDWQIIASNPGKETQRARAAREMEERSRAGTPFPSDPTGRNFQEQDGDGTDEDRDTYDPDAFAREQAAGAERRRVDNVVTTLRGVMNEYGLGALMGEIEGWVRSGLEGDAVMALVRESDAYNERFPAMRALRGKMRAISEAAYIEFERSAAGLERQYGLPAGMLGKDAVTRLLTAEVSERELEQRVVMASSAAYQVSQDVRNQFRDFYGVETGGLAAYFLDPERAAPLLNKQFVASQIGAEAAMQDISIGVGMAEELQMAGIERESARQGFGQVARTRGLSAGRGDVATQEQLIQGNLLQEEAALSAMERAALARRGRFEGGGGFQTTQQGITGLGSSAGT